MKVAPSTAIPTPERKPEPPPAPDGSTFRTVLVDTQTVPVPGRKPEALAAGQTMPPVPGRKPETVTADLAPVPARKPEAPPLPENTPAGRIATASQQVAGLSGHAFTAILAQATQESGLDPQAKSRTSTAAGPFQFLERTWLDLIRRHGAAYGLGDMARRIEVKDGVSVLKDPALRRQALELRHDIDLAAGMAARYMAEGRERLSALLKRPVSEAESRIAYVMGVGGAAKLIRAADSGDGVTAAELLPAAAKANGPLFYERDSGRPYSAAETVNRLARRMETEQRALFAAIDRAGQRPITLDGRPSPLGSFQSVEDLDASSSTVG